MKAIERFYEYINYKGIKPTRFEKDFGLSNGYLGTQYKRKGSLGEDILNIIINNCLDIDPIWLLTGKGEMLKKDIPIYKGLKTDKKGIPLIPAEAMAGFSNGDFSINDYDIQERYVVPDFKNIDFMIKVKGSSMYPKYNSGDVVACRIIKESSFIQWGKVYVIDSEQGALVKRLMPCDQKDFIICKSDNNSYPPFNIDKKEIRGIALVVGVIRLE